MATASVSVKFCPVCQTTKPVTDFYRCKSFRDGLDRRCSLCSKASRDQYRQTSAGKEAHRLESKRFRKTPKGVAIHRAGSARYYAKNKTSPLLRSRQAIRRAINSGKIPSARTLKCTHCDKQADGYHHHLGYERKHWLDVIPLCDLCHKKAEPH